MKTTHWLHFVVCMKGIYRVEVMCNNNSEHYIKRTFSMVKANYFYIVFVLLLYQNSYIVVLIYCVLVLLYCNS